jgi:glycosyltransferase involved in cell wall biosynthesis
MVAPPWLSIPPVGYGGIENVLAVLVPALMKLGVDVELFTVGDSTIRATQNYSLYKSGQYDYIHRPMYDSMPILIAQILFALRKVREAGDFDLIHCHNGFIGPLASAYSDDSLPPLVHTLHGPPFTTPDRLERNIPDNLPMWREYGLTPTNKIFFIGISEALMRPAPRELKHMILKPVHNAVDPSQFPFLAEKSDYFATLARSHPDKGQAVAVQAARKLGVKLKLAGVVADLKRPRQVLMELANPLSRYRGIDDFRYFSDEIFPYLDEEQVEYIGDLSGQAKLDFLAGAKALLFPIQWDEPFGMAPIEALACGTPVIAIARGALPEIIQHGVNGFLAHTTREFMQYMRRVDEIDPAVCRRSVEERFSAHHMAREYLQRYKTILRRTAGVRR